MKDERYDIGIKTVRELYGASGESVIASAADISPDFAAYIAESVGALCTRPGLDSRTRELTIITALATVGHVRTSLKVHLHGALNAGCTREEIVETLMVLSLYAGVPSALNAFSAANEVFRERGLGPGAADQAH